MHRLPALGIYLTYNGYGERLQNLHLTREALFTRVSRHADPLTFLENDGETFGQLEAGCRDDMAAAEAAMLRLAEEK